uniref:Uncharacterized protein n=1 Tax=Castor canadensis TaxID=51338 RepID=A0A8C0XEM3_CASCN
TAEPLRHSAREAPAFAHLGTARAPRRPQLPGPGPDASNPSAFLCLGQCTCSDAAAKTHPVGGASNSVSRKQKKKTSNRASVADGGEKASEKPAPEKTPPPPQSRGPGGTASSGSSLVRGAEPQLGLKMQRPTPKQKEQAIAAIRTLPRERTPLPGKRLLMRSLLGDYRAQMEAEWLEALQCVQLVGEATTKKSRRVCRPHPARSTKATVDIPDEEFSFFSLFAFKSK